MLSAVGSVHGEEAREHAFEVLLRDADPGVRHFRIRRLAALHHHGYAAVFLVVFGGVADEVAEYLRKTFRARGHDDRLFRIHRQSESAPFYVRAQRLRRFARGEGDVAVVAGQFVVVELVEVDDAGDEPGQPVRLRFYDTVRFFLRFLVQVAVFQQFRKPLYAGERGVHFVRDVGDELVFGFGGARYALLFLVYHVQLRAYLLVFLVQDVRDGVELSVFGGKRRGAFGAAR